MVIQGDARQLPLGDGSVQCVVTSPPYWGLRDYGLPASEWHDGWRGVLGLEPTPELYVQHLVECFREVRRVVRADGVCWINLGDSYAATNGSGPQGDTGQRATRTFTASTIPKQGRGLKPKDLVGIPWRVAFALQADGWYLRADVIWAKPNPMPESVTDRPTKAHEYLFLLAKSERYFYDAEAVREPAIERLVKMPDGWATHAGGHGSYHRNGREAGRPDNAVISGRNRRSVWTLATEPYPEAHFATFPEALVAPCILAGTSERGACGACGAPWERVSETEFIKLADRRPTRKALQLGADMADVNSHNAMGYNRTTTTGWRPTCACAKRRCSTYCLEMCSGACIVPTRPCLVLDPFGGSGTVGAVAERLGRRWVAVDLKPEYLAMAQRRTAQRGFAFLEGAPTNGHGHHGPLELVGDTTGVVVREPRW